jgi:hypothetical protein
MNRQRWIIEADGGRGRVGPAAVIILAEVVSAKADSVKS